MASLFGGAKTPTLPPIPPPAPLPDDNAILAAKRATIQQAMVRSGRLSTILTDGQGQSQKLGS